MACGQSNDLLSRNSVLTAAGSEITLLVVARTQQSSSADSNRSIRSQPRRPLLHSRVRARNSEIER